MVQLRTFLWLLVNAQDKLSEMYYLDVRVISIVFPVIIFKGAFIKIADPSRTKVPHINLVMVATVRE